ncbi:MAG: cytochrome P450 [Phormidium sp. BM_Day4_Bin.17]|nr:cytochrome P450 [Phormidium sp. BM_Day4_Bin.17]UCJ10885.1 MAG: cytochrome P450 [Phormidium sp. PBR-2020]
MVIKTPKTPPKWQLLEWIFDPTGYLKRNRAKLGETFNGRLGVNFDGFVFFSHPDHVRTILSAPARCFDAGRANGILGPLVGDNSLLLLDGQPHKQQRQLLMPPFHGDRMVTYGEIITQVTRQAIDRQPQGEAFRVRSLTEEITMRVILKAVFGLNEGEQYEKMRRTMSTFLDMTASPVKSSLLFFKSLQRNLGPWSPWGRFLAIREQLDALLYAEIRQRRQESLEERDDILSLLLLARDEEGQGMSDKELRDELVTLLLAGHETTATALAWALYWVHRFDRVRDRLIEDVSALGETPDPMAVFKLPYLTAVCNETLRIYPVALVTFPRIAKEPFQVGDYQFPAESVLAPCIYLTHHREDIFPDSYSFKPERFLERQYSPYEFYPFGGGNRRCLGMALAMYELKLALATLVTEHDFSLPPQPPVKPVRRGITLAPSAGLSLVKTR